MIALLSGWRHSGFHVFCGKRILPKEETALENLARYIIRASFSQDRRGCGISTGQEPSAMRRKDNPFTGALTDSKEIESPPARPKAILNVASLRSSAELIVVKWPMSFRCLR